MSLPNASRAILAGLFLACTAAPATPQSDPSPLPSRPLSVATPIGVPPVPSDTLARRVVELENWVHEYKAWKAWFVRWHNRREPGVWSWSTRPRRQKPEPPAWLDSTCDALLDDKGELAEGCRTLAEWKRDDFLALLAREDVLKERAEREKPGKTVWWQHVHLDALWPMTQSGSHAYGVFGTHVTMPLTTRVQVFLTPGAILMRVPSRKGGQTWTTATDWGFSMRLFDFTMPAMRRPSTVHVNFARVWILGAGGTHLSGDLYLAGFSLTFNPRPDSKTPD